MFFKRLKYKLDINLIVLIFFAFSVSILYLLFVVKNNSKTREINEGCINTLKKNYTITFSVYKDMADSIYNLYINTPQIKNLFRKGVTSSIILQKNRYRRQLYNKLKIKYQKLRKYDVRQIHFHEQNNISFLRMHRPHKFGDDLTEIRYSVKYVNQKKKYISGFEEGRIYNGYRFVYPLSFYGKHLGSIEISFSIGVILKQLRDKYSFKVQFLMFKEQVNKKLFKNELANYVSWGIDKNYLLDKALLKKYSLKDKITINDILRIRKLLKKSRIDGKPFCAEILIDKTLNSFTFIPIKNLQGKIVAYIFTVRKNNRLLFQKRNFLALSFIFLFLFIFVIIFILYYYLSQKKLKDIIMYDFLTKVYTRGKLFEKLDFEYKRYQRYNSTFSLIMIDIDFFKKVNDDYGHSAGDIVLVNVANVLKTKIRDTDAVGRYGGEEFIVLLPETLQKDAIIVAEKLRLSVSSLHLKGIRTVTISCGVTEVLDNYSSVDELIDSVDKKLYQAKEQGRNRVIS